MGRRVEKEEGGGQELRKSSRRRYSCSSQLIRMKRASLAMPGGYGTSSS